VCGLETSTVRQPRPNLGCFTKKKMFIEVLCLLH